MNARNERDQRIPRRVGRAQAEVGSELKHAAMAGSLLADISRLGPENEFTDVVITAGDHRREANSVILAARSPVFRNMLASRMLEGQLLDGKRHVHLQDIPKAVLDHILHWCYTDSVSNLDMSESMDLLMAADRFELSGLVLRCSQRLSKMLSAAELPEVLELAKRFSCTALWDCLAPVIAKAGPGDAGVLEDMPERLRQKVLEERRHHLERRVVGLRERLSMVPAPRPSIVFWRQQLSEHDQHELVEQALLKEGGVPALFHGLREKLPGFFREACQKRWLALDASTKQSFEARAIEDAEKSEEAHARLEEELEDVRRELKLLRA